MSVARRHELRVFFIWVVVVTWGLGAIGMWLPRVLPIREFSSSSVFYWAAGYAITTIGIVLTAAYDGRAGIRRLFSRLDPRRAAARWYAVVLMGYAGLGLMAFLVARFFDVSAARVPGATTLFSAFAATLVRDPGPLGEEIGWRGFALPRLLDVRSPLAATAVLGTIHALWHLPLFFIPGLAQHGRSFPAFAVGVVAIAVFNTWIYLRARGSLVLAVLIHFMANFCGGLLDAQAFPYFALVLGAAALIIVAAGGLRST